MIEVKNITKSFDGRVVLKDISTTFEDESDHRTKRFG